ncbi:hypothetical protein HB818_10560 [Listeria booriae]|uniref:hypothetical protein n=1 Tax=Listeria booriae TaxID=1552123 RepID=UPI00162324B1|nr:hypothetical protein [Listeria booriae]MBC1286195.1 hypothetical protein [Listeria booriae]
MEMNTAMKEVWASQEDNQVKLDMDVMLNVLYPEFVLWDRCILLNISKSLSMDGEQFIPSNTIEDRTQLEAFINHIHLIDFFPKFEDIPNKSLQFGVSVIEIWEQQLKKQYPMEKFQLVVSYDEFGCTLGFYTLRKNEEVWLDTADLEKYSEALLVKEV